MAEERRRNAEKNKKEEISSITTVIGKKII